jgi:hypothetical protein
MRRKKALHQKVQGFDSKFISGQAISASRNTAYLPAVAGCAIHRLEWRIGLFPLGS